MQDCGKNTCKNYEPIGQTFAKSRLEIMAETLWIWEYAMDTDGEKPEWAYERYWEACPFCEDARNRRLTTWATGCGVCFLKKENSGETCGLPGFDKWYRHRKIGRAHV